MLSLAVDDAATAARPEPERRLVAQLLGLSQALGADPELVLGGGGNTSVKLGQHLLVKASGAALATAGPEDFVTLDRAVLQALLDGPRVADRDQREALFKQGLLTARVEPQRAQRPSVESVLHHLLPGTFVAHLHATVVNQFSCCRQGESLVARELAGEAMWVGLVDPGLALARSVRAGMRAFAEQSGGRLPRAIIMQNHGVVIDGGTPEEVQGTLEWLLASLQGARSRARGARAGAGGRALGPAAPAAVGQILASLRDVLNRPAGQKKHVQFFPSQPVAELMGRADRRELVMGGPLTPDQIVYCRSFPLWVEAHGTEDTATLQQHLGTLVRRYVAAYGALPAVILVDGVGLFTAGDSWAETGTAGLVYIDAIKVMLGTSAMGGTEYLPQDFRQFIEQWEVESYRRAVASRQQDGQDGTSASGGGSR
jgi:rhamnose utilization protein RhaD (predicted bifunctional aldolase and dehydrogenase)